MFRCRFSFEEDSPEEKTFAAKYKSCIFPTPYSPLSRQPIIT